MRSLAQLFQRKEKQKKVIDEKTILYITRNVILREYGNKGLENIQATAFREGRLNFWVGGSIWESEVLLQRVYLKKVINEECGKKVIQEIFVKK